MSDLETDISKLERELALKRGYQAVRFVLPKSLPDDVAQEIMTKLREQADKLATLDYASLEVAVFAGFSEEELGALRLIATTVLKKTVDLPVATATVLNGGVTTTVPTANGKASPGGSSVHVPKEGGLARKARIVTAENVRGEGRRFAAPEDELFVPNPEKVDAHGMVSATHMKRGVMIKIPLDDVSWID